MLATKNIYISIYIYIQIYNNEQWSLAIVIRPIPKPSKACSKYRSNGILATIVKTHTKKKKKKKNPISTQRKGNFL